MNIAGWTKTSLIDFPGCASTVIFVGGCNFRCAYCHNPEIVLAGEPVATVEELLAFLQKRRRFLDGVCISGGEPTLDEELQETALRIKRAGYALKLDSNGTRPDVLRSLIEDRLVDYVAMDIKAPLDRYDEVAGAAADTQAIAQSIHILLDGKVEYEFRTTVCRELIGEEDIRRIGGHIKGAERYFIQNYRKTGADGGFAAQLSPHSQEQLARFCQIAQDFVKEAGYR